MPTTAQRTEDEAGPPDFWAEAAAQRRSAAEADTRRMAPELAREAAAQAVPGRRLDGETETFRIHSQLFPTTTD